MNEVKEVAKLIVKLFFIALIVLLMDNYLPKQDYQKIEYVVLIALILLGIFLVFLNGKINRIIYFLLLYILYPLLFSFALFKTWHYALIMSIILIVMNFEQVVGSFLKLMKNKRER